MTAPFLDKRRMEPLAEGWSSFMWDGGNFDTARRPATAHVEGAIELPRHLLLVTLEGGADRIEVSSTCGHHFLGQDRQGSVSFIPAFTERSLKMTGVNCRWASIALSPQLFADETAHLPAFTNLSDKYLFGIMAEFERLHSSKGGLDSLYCEAMSLGLTRYLLRKYGSEPFRSTHVSKLPAWRIRRIAEYVDANIEAEIRISDIADEIGLSTGHFHRAFRAATGVTPLQFIHGRRIARAREILKTEEVGILGLALRVGFQSPSHFARVFRVITGFSPSEYKQRRAGASSSVTLETRGI